MKFTATFLALVSFVVALPPAMRTAGEDSTNSTVVVTHHHPDSNVLAHFCVKDHC
jgi:glyoxylase-like metal-dependent hydrolase (beta-lactamase superfamily II)